MSRLLPTPASPSSVTSRHSGPATARRNSASRAAISRSRPTSGRSGAPHVGGDREQPVGRDGFRLALQCQRLDRYDLDGFSYQPVGGLADQDLTDRSNLLEPGGDVHRVAGGQALCTAALTGDDFAGVDAGPVLQGDPEPGPEGDVQLRQRLAHLRCRAHRAQRVVLVHPRQTEHGHDRIPDVLFDRPAVALQHWLHRREVQREHLSQRLTVEPIAQLRRALQIAEDNGDGLADLLGRWLRGEDGAAVAAEPEPVGVFLAAARARLHYLSLRPCPADGHYDVGRSAGVADHPASGHPQLDRCSGCGSWVPDGISEREERDDDVAGVVLVA